MQTPKGFQAVRPQASRFAGGTILNWAGRVPEIERIEEVSARETVEVGTWDSTLSELRDDPEIEDAIEAIDSDPPPAAFVRSTPPGAPISGPPARFQPDRWSAPVPDYHEPPEVDPPPLTYEQVFDQGSAEGSLRAPRPVQPGSVAPESGPKPSVLPWALLLLAIVCGAGAVAFVVSQRRGPPTASERVPATEAPLPAEPPPTTVTATAAERPAAEPEPAPKREPAAEPEPAAATQAAAIGDPVENPDAIYPPTGAADTYAAQLDLARRLKRGSRAVAAYRRAIALNPEGSDALAELGRLMLARQHTREATELAERATAIDPSNALAWVTLGAARQMRGDRQGARQAYQNCAKLGRGPYVSECRAMLR